MAAGLEDLDMTGCSALASLPHDLGNLQSLTRLELASCASLASLPPSVAQLHHLRVLNLRDCGQLTALPAELLTAITGDTYGGGGGGESSSWDAPRRDPTHYVIYQSLPRVWGIPSADQQYQPAGARYDGSPSVSPPTATHGDAAGRPLRGRDMEETRGGTSTHDVGVSSPDRGCPDRGVDEEGLECTPPSVKSRAQQGSPSSAATSAAAKSAAAAATSAENPVWSPFHPHFQASPSPSVPGRSSYESFRTPPTSSSNSLTGDEVAVDVADDVNDDVADVVADGGPGTQHVTMPGLLFLVTAHCSRLQRPMALAAATAELACRMIDLRFASRPQADGQDSSNTWAAVWGGDEARGLPKHLMPRWSQETMACLEGRR